jgi:hypothetical protein
MNAKQFTGLSVGLMVKSNKTLKSWIITDFVTSYSAVNKSNPDQFKVRLSDGAGKNTIVSVDALKKNYTW